MNIIRFFDSASVQRDVGTNYTPHLTERVKFQGEYYEICSKETIVLENGDVNCYFNALIPKDTSNISSRGGISYC